MILRKKLKIRFEYSKNIWTNENKVEHRLIRTELSKISVLQGFDYLIN